MIPKEKIEQAANEYSIKINRRFKSANLIIRRAASQNDFTAGVSFAETELQPKYGVDTIQNLFNYFQQDHGIMLMPSDLWEIEKFMQPELQSISIEFAEWCDEEFTQDQHGIWKNFMSSKIPDHKLFTSAELFAKFVAERQTQ